MITRLRKNLGSKVRELYLTWIFFTFLLGIGLANFRDFGIAWDSPALRLNGGSALIYIADLFGLKIVPSQYRQFPSMGENGMADHGVAYDMILGVIESFLGISEPIHVYQMRTLMNFLVFVLGTLAIYLMVLRRLSSRNIALLASLFFVLSPRIFAAGFYSPADMIFSSFFALAANFSLRFISNPNWKNATMAGLASGFATDIRLIGILIFPLITLAFVAQHCLRLKQNLASLGQLGLYLGSGIIGIYLFFPYLWADPVMRFLEVFQSLSRYPWGGNNLYFGKLIPANDLPWHYIPTWVLITTPVLYVLLFVIGTVRIAVRLVTERKLTETMIQDLFFVSLVFVPILIVVYFNSVLYDTWRHLFFIYPFIILVATIGWDSVSRTRLPKRLAYHGDALKNALTGIAVFPIALWMIMNNPNQHLFFNSLAGKANLQEKWEMDYWGLSNRQALEYLFSKDNRAEISVSVVSWTPFDMSLKVLPSEFSARLRVIPIEETPDYIVNNYRLVSDKFVPPAGYVMEKVFTIENSKYFEIWKRSSL